MSDRYGKNVKVDGWPVRDTKEDMDMSKHDVIDALNIYEQRLSRTKAELEEAKKLLEPFAQYHCDDKLCDCNNCKASAFLSNQQSEE